MRFYAFFLLAMLLILPISVNAQSRFDNPADMPVVNTYVPIPSEMYMLMKMMASDPEIRERLKQRKLLEEQQRKKKYESYVLLGNGCLKKGQVANFLDCAHAALKCGYYNSTLYYNMGIAYVILKKKRKGKKWLKKAFEHGQYKAHSALYAMKKKQEISYSWFIY